MRSPSERRAGSCASAPKAAPPLFGRLGGARVAARRRATVLRPAVPLAVSPTTVWKAFTALVVSVSYVAVGRDVEAGALQQLLELADVRAAHAGAQRAGAQRRGADVGSATAARTPATRGHR